MTIHVLIDVLIPVLLTTAIGLFMRSHGKAINMFGNMDGRLNLIAQKLDGITQLMRMEITRLSLAGEKLEEKVDNLNDEVATNKITLAHLEERYKKIN